MKERAAWMFQGQANTNTKQRRVVELEMLLVCEAMRVSKQNSPWWLDEGSELCPACSHAYVIQTEYRCVACDGPLCGMCVETTIDVEVFCPSCVSPPTRSETAPVRVL